MHFRYMTNGIAQWTTVLQYITNGIAQRHEFRSMPNELVQCNYFWFVSIDISQWHVCQIN